MPISISGLSSGLDTDGIIDKLVKIEREPIKKLEREKKLHSLRIKSLQDLSKKLLTLSDAAKELYGFRASFNDTKVTSADESIITAKGSKNAGIGDKEIQVLQTASAHKIATDPVEKEFKISGGKLGIEVNGETASIKFKGGRLDALKEAIEEKAQSLVSVSSMKTSGNNFILIIQSKVMGKKGEIKLTGDSEFLKSIGLVNGEKSEEKDKVGIVFDKKFFTSYLGSAKVDAQSGSLAVGDTGKKATFTGTLWREYVLPVELPVKKNTTLEFSVSYTSPKESDQDEVPSRIEFGPDESISVKGIKLFGYNVSRLRKTEKTEPPKTYDSALGVGVVSSDGGTRVEKIYLIDRDSKGKQEIPIGNDFKDKKISRVIFYCNTGTTEFSDAVIATGRESKGELGLKNILSPAADLKMKVDGIEIVREKNTELSDIIPGLTITVKKKSEETVMLHTETDTGGGVDKVKKFVDAYNEFIAHHKSLVKTVKTTKPNEIPDEDSGLFVGDLMLMRLEGNIKKIVMSAYTSNTEKPVRLLSELGITTGKINAGWESIKEGKLVVDETVLGKEINDNSEGVTLFFGSDSDGDNKIDTGMAYSLVNQLRPYISAGKNIIASKIDLEKDSIKMADDRIVKHEDHVAKYEDRLRKKFAKMEQSLNKTKSQQEWMKNQMGDKEK